MSMPAPGRIPLAGDRSLAETCRAKGLTQLASSQEPSESLCMSSTESSAEYESSLYACASRGCHITDVTRHHDRRRRTQNPNHVAQPVSVRSTQVGGLAGRNLVMTIIVVLVTIRLLTEVFDVIPRAANFVDIPIPRCCVVRCSGEPSISSPPRTKGVLRSNGDCVLACRDSFSDLQFDSRGPCPCVGISLSGVLAGGDLSS